MLMQRLVAKYNMIVSGFGKPETHPGWTRLSRVGRLKRPLVCVKCGCKGTLIVQYRHANEPETAVHHDIFAINASKDIVMLTVDHILPQSWGGHNQQSNLQIMCQPCNNNKKNVVCENELRAIIQDMPKHFSFNKKSSMFITLMKKQHKSLATIDNFKLITK